PVVGAAGIEVKDIVINITTHGATHVLVDVLVAIVINVGKRNAVTFLQVAETARSGDILEAHARIVAKHAIGNNTVQVWVPRADVKIKKAIVIEVSEIGAHAQ